MIVFNFPETLLFLLFLMITANCFPVPNTNTTVEFTDVVTFLLHSKIYYCQDKKLKDMSLILFLINVNV